jgi:hypothetical protein
VSWADMGWNAGAAGSFGPVVPGGGVSVSVCVENPVFITLSVLPANRETPVIVKPSD